MYPETDIPPMPITEQVLDSLRDKVPKSWEVSVNELSTKYGLNKVLAEKIFDSDYLVIFEEITSDTKIQPTFIASTLTESLVGLERQSLDIASLTSSIIKDAFLKLDKGEVAKESILQIFEVIMKKEANDVDEAIAKLGLKAIGDEQLNEILDKIVRDNAQVIAQKGDGAISVLMGKAMNTLRGRVDGQKVNTLLKEKIAKLVG